MYPNSHQQYPHLQQHQSVMQGPQTTQQQPVQQQWLQQSNGVVGPLYSEPTHPGTIYNPFAQMSVNSSTFAPTASYHQHAVGVMTIPSQTASGEPQIPIIPELEGTPAQLTLLVDAILNHTGTAAHIEKLKLAFTTSWYVVAWSAPSHDVRLTALALAGCYSRFI